MAPIYLGGCIRAAVERGRAPGSAPMGGDTGILAASGLVAGEGLAGIVVAGLVGAQIVPKAAEPLLGPLGGEWGAVALLLALCFFLYRAGRSSPA